MPHGKWTAVFKDSVFIDSKKVLTIYTDLFFDKVLAIIKTRFVQNQKLTKVQRVKSYRDYVLFERLFKVSRILIKQIKINEYAPFCFLKGSDSQNQFIKNEKWSYEAINLLN